jgi:uncharacterized OsmC-like protein
MTTSLHIQETLLRACETFERRPSAALHEDAAALAVWDGGLGTRLMHDAVPALRTDMPAALGGEGQAPSPGWYFRAGVASCMATSIAIQAALRGIALTRLEVEAHSESDARGVLGVAEDVPAGPLRVWLNITLEAEGTPEADLRDLVRAADAHAPMSSGLRRALDVAVDLRVIAPAGA